VSIVIAVISGIKISHNYLLQKVQRRSIRAHNCLCWAAYISVEQGNNIHRPFVGYLDPKLVGRGLAASSQEPTSASALWASTFSPLGFNVQSLFSHICLGQTWELWATSELHQRQSVCDTLGSH